MSDREKGGTVDIVHGRKNDDGTEELIDRLPVECIRSHAKPKTDKQKLEDLLKSFGCTLTTNNYNDEEEVVSRLDDSDDGTWFSFDGAGKFTGSGGVQ